MLWKFILYILIDFEQQATFGASQSAGHPSDNTGSLAKPERVSLAKSKCLDDNDCQDSLVCRFDGSCVTRGKGKGAFGDECEHRSDCNPELDCFEKKCGSLGLEGDLCKAHIDCRGSFYCSTTNQPSKCKPRREVGQRCVFDYHCINSICQLERYAVNGGDQVIEGKEFFCSSLSAKLGQPCDPKKAHCTPGLICTQSAKQGVTVKKTAFAKQPRDPLYQSTYQTSYNAENQISVLRRRRDVGSEESDIIGSFSSISTSQEISDIDFDDFSTENDEEAQNLDYQYLAPKGRSVFKKVKTNRRNRGSKKQPVSPFICQHPPCMGSKDICKSTLDCGCGEFCNERSSSCRVATCAAGFECQAYPGYTHRFSCRNNICMPPQSVYGKAFEGKKQASKQPKKAKKSS